MANPNLSFKYELEKKAPRTNDGGITRGASVTDFPASIGIAGVSMRLAPGSMREMHWHANAAEWGYVITGACRTTILHPDGTSYIDYFYPGDIWYFPKGYGHSIQAISDDECHFILIFDNGDFSEDHTFSVTDFVSSVPPEIAAQNLGLTLEEVAKLPQKEAYFAAGPVPDPSTTLASARSEADISLVSMHRYPLHAQQPRIVPGGGTQRLVTSKEFPISTTMSGSFIEMQPGTLREMHWHPNADEWQYFIEGQAEMGVFLAQGNFVKDQFNAGDVGYVPMGAGHYIKNTGDTVLKILLGFNSGIYQSVDLSEWISSNPKDVVETNFSLPPGEIDEFPTGKIFMKPKN